MDALDAGRDVMVFSDNVPVEQEVALKRTAAERGLLVMGPDCGTAVVGGLGLGFANVVSPGPVGIVAASGTGCQQLLALLDHAGVGVTSALGVGGRDLSVRGPRRSPPARRCAASTPTRRVELIVVVSKPPAPEVATEIEEYAAGLSTPVEFALLGAGSPTSPLPPRPCCGGSVATCRPGRSIGSAARGHGRAPRAVRRRHPQERGPADRPAAEPGTRSSTSATTSTPRAGRTR